MDEYQEVFGVPAEAAEETAPAGRAKTSGRTPVPPPKKAKETRIPPSLALRNSRKSPPPAPLARRRENKRTGRPERRSGTVRHSFAASGRRRRDRPPSRRAGIKSMRRSLLDR